MKKSDDDNGPSKKLSRRALLLRGLAAAAVVPFATLSDHAEAQTYYDAYGNLIVVNPTVIAQPVVVYDPYRRPLTIYPAHPAYYHSPRLYGPGGVRGVARRTSRRTSRRRSRRR